MPPRYAPGLSFPPYAFIPGKNPHPEKKGGHYEGQKIQISSEVREDFYQCLEFYHGIDLFNHGFFWEAHVYWEALWHLFPKKSNSALFLQALIKLAAAQVKWQMEQDGPAGEHAGRALELLRELISRGYDGPRELPLKAFLQEVEQKNKRGEKKLLILLSREAE